MHSDSNHFQINKVCRSALKFIVQIVVPTFLLLIYFARPASAQKTEPDAVAIARSVMKRMTESGAVSYSYSFRGEGTAKAAFPQSSGKAVVVPGQQPGQIASARLIGEMASQNSEIPVLYHAALQDEVVHAVNYQERILYHAPVYRGGASLFNSKLLIPIEVFVIVRDELANQPEKITAYATEVVNNTRCVPINFVTETGVEIRMFVGEEDPVLHRLEATMKQLGGWASGRIVVELNDVQLGQKVNEQDFLIPLPDGFTVREYSGNFPAIGEQAPDWTLTTSDGATLKLSDLKGQVVVMDFWATWCLPCIKGIPYMQTLHDEFSERPVRILGLTYNEQGDPVAMMKRHNACYPVLNADSIAKEYNLAASGLPITYVIDRNGKVKDFFIGGEAIEKHLKSAVQTALSEGE